MMAKKSFSFCETIPRPPSLPLYLTSMVHLFPSGVQNNISPPDLINCLNCTSSPHYWRSTTENSFHAQLHNLQFSSCATGLQSWMQNSAERESEICKA